MRLISTPEQDRLWSIIEPYLKLDGLKLVLDSNAPDYVKEANEKYEKLSNEAIEQYERDWIL